MTMNALHKMAGKTNQKALYPQPENQLSEIFNKYGKDLKSTTFGYFLYIVDSFYCLFIFD